MQSVVTLIANTDKLELTNSLINQVVETLAEAGLKITDQNWLSEGEAADLMLNLPNHINVSHYLASSLENKPIDAIVQPVANRKKKLLIADMDSTIITCECIDEIADELGIKDKVSAITEAAMQGKIDFESALIERVAMLEGVSVAALQRIYDDRVKFTKGAKTLIATMNKANAQTLLVSGGFTFFTERVAQALNFTENYGNRLEMHEGKLTGTVIQPILGADAKLETLLNACSRFNLDSTETIAIGDGANDLRMIKAAGMGVSYYGKPIMVQESKASIAHTDLSSLLFLQGYHRHEFC